MSRFTVTNVAALALAVAVSAWAVPAGAQSGRGGAELTIFNGYYIASDLYTSTNGGAQIGLENSYMYGARIGVDPNPRVGVEFAWTHAGSDVTVRNPPSGYDDASDPGRLNLNSYGLDFLFYQPTTNAKTTGFFTLGFGWTVTDPEVRTQAGTTVDSNSLFNWNFGAGAKINMNEKFALRLEGRWRVTDTAITTSSGVYCDYWGYCYSYASDWYSSGELTAGLTYKLGGR